MELAKEVYKITPKLPKTEAYALANQMQRAAASIPSNISEGYGRNNRKEYIQFLGVANGSACELETQLLLAKSLYKKIDTERAMKLVDEAQRMLIVMINKLRN